VAGRRPPDDFPTGLVPSDVDHDQIARIVVAQLRRLVGETMEPSSEFDGGSADEPATVAPLITRRGRDRNASYVALYDLHQVSEGA
jgi:hypothetical protein